MDDGMIYFDARLSAHYPTLEIRVADVCTDVDDAVIIAVLGAGHGGHRGQAVAGGGTGTRLQIRAVARYVVAGGPTRLVRRPARPTFAGAGPAFDLIGGLVEWLEPSLTEYGDLPLVEAGVERLRASGNGADQQRRSFQVHGDLEEVVADLVRRTLV